LGKDSIQVTIIQNATHPLDLGGKAIVEAFSAKSTNSTEVLKSILKPMEKNRRETENNRCLTWKEDLSDDQHLKEDGYESG